MYQSTLRDARQLESLNHHIVKPKVEPCYEFFDACMVPYVCIWNAESRVGGNMHSVTVICGPHMEHCAVVEESNFCCLPSGFL